MSFNFIDKNIFQKNIPSLKIFEGQKISNISTPWLDDIFPPSENSLLGKNNIDEYFDQNEGKYKMIHSEEIEWKRIDTIIPHPMIYEDIIDTSNLRYGRLSYIYFHSVLTALSNKFPSIFTKSIINKEYNPDGIYSIILFIDNEFQIVLIDDFFPCIKNSNILYFMKPSNFAFWAILIEKAWAKVNCGYQNIINLWPCDLLKALTGSVCDVLIHDELTNEEIFNELNEIDKNNGICISLTKNSNDVMKNGLKNYHMYILIDSEKIELDKNKCILLCKYYDPIENGLGIEDISETKGSLTMTKEILDKINGNKLKLKNGEFWMRIEDVKKLFLRSDVCHMIFDGFSKVYEFKKENDELIFPKIFNFFMPEEGMVSISIFQEKNWHFHREIRELKKPTSLIIAEYDNKNNEIKNIILTKYQSNEDTEISKFLPKGFYLVWAYSMNSKENNLIKIRFCSDIKIGIKYLGDDTNFEVIKSIIIQNAIKKNINKNKKKKIFYETKNSFEKSGIGYTLCINSLDNIYQEWKIKTDKLEGYFLFPPFDNKKQFDMKIESNSNAIIVGIKKEKYGEHWFNLNIEVTQFENNNANDNNKIFPNNEEKEELKNITNINSNLSKDNNDFEIISGTPTFSFEEIKVIKNYPKFDHWKLFLEKYKDKYPFIINELEKLESLDNERLDLIEISKDNTIYIGESDYIIRTGRGAMIFKNEEVFYVGYWDNGRQFNRGKVFDLNNNNLIYDGEYKKGLKDGYGIYYYQNGEKYEGKFRNGIREGKGVFFWKDGNKWEGYFKNNEMNGEGIFYDNNESFPAIYKDGELIE